MMKTIYDYTDSMEQIETEIPEQIFTAMERVRNATVTEAEIEGALASVKLTERDFYALLSDLALEKYFESMADRAQKERLKYFGNNVALFSPLYLANYCENGCRYCGFRGPSPIHRLKLTEAEIEAEMAALAETGIEDVLLLTGESRKYSDISYIAKAVEMGKEYFTTIGLEIYPGNVEDYRILHEAGADFVTIFQESYQGEVYNYFHPFGNKRNILYRMNGQERALRGGMRGVGFGALFGLAEDSILETFALGTHAALLQKKYPQAEISLSLPRIRPTAGADQSADLHLISSKKLFQIMCALRIYLPFANIVLSTREDHAFRQLAVQYGCTKISASVDTGIGRRAHRNDEEGDGQFVIANNKSTQEVVTDLRAIGMTPVFTDYLYL